MLCVGREFQHDPAHCGCGVEFLHVVEIALWSGMSALRPHPSVNLDCYLVFRDCVVEPPLACGVELMLFYALDFQVGATEYREKVRFWGLRLRLSRFLVFLGYLFHFRCVVDFRGVSVRLLAYATNGGITPPVCPVAAGCGYRPMDCQKGRSSSVCAKLGLPPALDKSTAACLRWSSWSPPTIGCALRSSSVMLS